MLSVLLSQFFAQDDIRVALTPAQREMLDKWNCLTSVQQAALAAPHGYDDMNG